MATNNNDKTLNVPHLRFPEFSGEWEIYPLTDFMSFKNGMNPDAKRFGRGTKFISVMDILNNQFICYDNIRASVEITDGDIETYGVSYGDVLFQRSSETLEDVGQANVYLDSQPAVFGGFVIRGKSKGNYHPMFFRYLLASPTARKKIIVKGAGAQHFNIGQDGLSTVYLNIPSIQEQEKIAKLLECIDTRITTQNKIIEKLESLIRGIYKTLLGESDQYRYLDELCEIKKGVQVNKEELSEKGLYYVMNGGITPSGYYDLYNTEANTISISEGGNSCGYVQYNYTPFWSGGHCYTLENISNVVDNRYLFHYLKANELQIMSLRIGSGLPNIQKKDLSAFRIPLPALNKQINIAKALDTLLYKITVDKNIYSTYKQQKEYLLQQMFI